MFRYHHKMFSQIFDQYFVKHSAIHQYITRQSDLYLLPVYKKDIGRRSISFLGVKIWKQLILAKIDLDTPQPVFKINIRRCMQQGTINTVFNTVTSLLFQYYESQGFAVVVIILLLLYNELCLRFSGFPISTFCTCLFFGKRGWNRHWHIGTYPGCN